MASLITFRLIHKNSKILAFVFLTVLAVSAPVFADASVLSFISDLFSDETANASVQNNLNSQNMALPEAVANINSSSATATAGETQLVSDTALLAVAGPSGTSADIEIDTPSSDQISTYVVHKGDTLSEIAGMFDVSINTIVWANGLNRKSALKEGQILVILPISGIKHQVLKGETLNSIAKKYGGDKAEIISFNGLDSEKDIKVGDILIIPDGEASVSKSSSSSSSSSNNNYSSNQSSTKGYYAWPVSGGRKTQGLHGNNGIDIGAPAGTPILASADGTVIISRLGGWNGGYGNYIVIKHDNGTQTLYAHTSSVSVDAGQKVSKGQKIGGVGSTGKSTGNHLHFEVRGAKNPF
jgi:LysM repeat protein